MIIKPGLTTSAAGAASSSSAAAPTVCGNCGLEERRLLHHIRHRTNFRRLCTSCVLRLNSQNFCPHCYAVYDTAAPPPPQTSQNDTVMCFKCYSVSHDRCVGPNYSRPYICPMCINPNSPIFTLKKVKDYESLEGVSGSDVNNGEYKVIDKKAAKILLAAAKIANATMTKAAVSANDLAEKRAREAALARKRAREVLEHVAYLVTREKLKKKEAAMFAAPSTEVSWQGGVRRDNVNNVGGNVEIRSANMSNGVVERQRVVGNVGRVDGSNDVLAAFNAVELREGGGKKEGIKVEDSVVGAPLTDDVALMDVEGNGGLEVKAELMDAEAVHGDHSGGGSENERSVNLDQLGMNHGGQGDNVSNGPNGQVLVMPIEDPAKHIENGQPGKLTNNGSEQ